MLYSSLKALHLLSVIVWLGGMFFVLACLRPAAAELLEPPARVRLMHGAIRRFLAAVTIAIVVIVLSGMTMIALASGEARRSGLAFNMPLDWYAMIGLFVVMLLVFVHIRLAPFRRLEAALAAEAWPAAGAAMSTIRWEVMLNLVLGVFVVVLVRLGGNA